MQVSSILWILTHWGQVTHIYVSKTIIIGSDNGLSPGRHQAIFWTNAGILLIRPQRINFNKILIKIHIISFKKIHCLTDHFKQVLISRMGETALY